MLRALALSMGLLLLLLWMIALVEEATVWLTWVDGAATFPAVLAALSVRDDAGAARAAAARGAVSAVLAAATVAGAVTGATPWLTWFTGIAAGGMLVAAGLTLVARVVQPTLRSRRGLGGH